MDHRPGRTRTLPRKGSQDIFKTAAPTDATAEARPNPKYGASEGLGGSPRQGACAHDYWSKTRNDIVPGIRRHRLDKLAPEHLEKMYRVMLDEGHAPSHVLKVHRILSRALKIAHRRRMIVENVATPVDPPTVDETKANPFTTDEAKALLQAPAERPTSYGGAPVPRWAFGKERCSVRGGRASTSKASCSTPSGSSSASHGAMVAMIRTPVALAFTASSPARRTAIRTKTTRAVAPSRARRRAQGTRAHALSARAGASTTGACTTEVGIPRARSRMSWAWTCRPSWRSFDTPRSARRVGT